MEELKTEIELIKHAAVKSVDGQIFMAKQHADCFGKAHYIKVKLSSKAEDQGFVTNKGRYLTRGEAAKLALESGQIDKVTPILFSEDLWCPTYEGKYDYDHIKGYLLRENHEQNTHD